MQNKKKTIKKESLVNFGSSIMAIIFGLLFGFIILLLSSPANAAGGFSMIIQGGFTDGAAGWGQVLYFATPIIMTGLSVGFAFKTGLFNIGAAGQYVVGAYVAVHIGVLSENLGNMHWVVALIVAFIAGAIWGTVPGILKAYMNVNEVISSIMMNYIGMYLVNIFIKENVFDQLKNQSLPVSESAVLPKGGMDTILAGSDANISIFIVLLFVILAYIILEKTTFGYELKACGQNRNASKYAGINAKRNIVLSMAISGALAGLGGGLMYLSGAGKHLQVVDIIAPEGFTGISVALLGLSNPIGIFFAGIFIAYITVGGSNMQLFGFAPEVIDIIIAAIIYCGALSLLFKNFIKKREMKKLKAAEVKEGEK